MRIMVLFIFVVFANCTSTRSIPERTVINQPNVGYYLKKGDTVKVISMDDSVYHFVILSIDETHLSGKDIKVPFLSIKEIETGFGKMSADPLSPYKIEKKHESRLMYKVWIRRINNTELSGLLYSVEDNKLRISTWHEMRPYDIDQFTYQDINADKIETVKIKRKSKVPMFIGVVSGVVIGTVIGSQTSKDTFFGEETEVAGALVLGGVIGGGLGAALGAIRINIPINGSVELYKANQARLKKYSYRQQP
jgi:hypothetical protein